jgi:UDPglucose 6-dehydrogenase
MKLTVAGTGYVGLVTAVCMAEKGHDVTCVDVDQKKICLMQSGISPVYEDGLQDLMVKNKERLHFTTDFQKAYQDAEVIFIGVGTPEQEDGSANLSYVRAVAKQIAENIERDCVVVVKSTVPIGTNEEVEESILKNLKNHVNVFIASNPEFLSQGTAVRDTLHAKRVIIGTQNEAARKILAKVYEPFGLPMIFTDRRTAEMTKYACNDFLALKISYINEIANFCSLIGANVEDVIKGMSYDPRIGDKFLQPGIGYGGSCFPKDTKALYSLAKKQYGFEFRTIKASIDVNLEQKTKLFFLARKDLGSFDNRRVCLLGLTFKPGTDDLRESPAFDMASSLLKDGAVLFAFDPIGMKNMAKFHPNDIVYCHSAIEAIEKSEVVFLLTDWPVFKNIPLSAFKEKYVYDGRNCLSVDTKKIAKIYKSIGRP